jgi:hypothetical protein
VAPFRVRFETASEFADTGPDISATVTAVHEAGGTDVSVFQNEERGRAEFSLEAPNRAQAVLAAHRVLAALTNATPLVYGGWVFLSITAM